MYLPKWIVIILFASALLSTAALTYVLAFAKENPAQLDESKNVVVVTASPQETVMEQTKVPEPEKLLSSTEWETHKDSKLEMQCDFPKTWNVMYDDADSALIISDPASVNKSITFTRRKKSSATEKLEEIAKSRKETLGKESISVTQNAQSPKVDGYDAIVLSYQKESNNLKEIIFGTRNYVYSIVIVPDTEESKSIFDEIMSSFKIV